MLFGNEIWDQHMINRKDSCMLNITHVWGSFTLWNITYTMCKQIVCVPQKAINIYVLG